MKQKDMVEALGNCNDFKNQKSQLAEVLDSMGHMMELSPKFACEMAGLGIEYSWGRSKIHSRKHTTNKNSDLEERVTAALSKEVHPLALTRKYARITRDYMALYKSGLVGSELDKIRRKCKTHRCALDSHYAMLQENNTGL